MIELVLFGPLIFSEIALLGSGDNERATQQGVGERRDDKECGVVRAIQVAQPGEGKSSPKSAPEEP